MRTDFAGGKRWGKSLPQVQAPSKPGGKACGDAEATTAIRAAMARPPKGLCRSWRAGALSIQTVDTPSSTTAKTLDGLYNSDSPTPNMEGCHGEEGKEGEEGSQEEVGELVSVSGAPAKVGALLFCGALLFFE
jgi:hypothetical protein